MDVVPLAIHLPLVNALQLDFLEDMHKTALKLYIEK